MQGVHPVRLVLKAAALFAAFNLAFAVLEPPVGRLSIYGWMVPGRERLPYEDAEDEALGYNLMLYEDFDAMFAAHLISTPKPPEEYRIILLGDSSIWGYNLPVADVLSRQLNRRGLQLCGRAARVYDLGYMGSDVPKDLLFLERGLRYEPDLILWFVTLNSFSSMSPLTIGQIFGPHALQALQLIRAHGLRVDTTGLHPPGLLEKSLLGQRARLKKLAVLQLDGLLWAATGIDFHLKFFPAMDANMTADPGFGRDRSGTLDRDSLLLEVLGAGYQISGATPLWVVNEPIYIATGENRDLRYDRYYPRWAYDQYRDHLQSWMGQFDHPYLDLWDAVPPSGFGETPLHLTGSGEAQLAERLTAELGAAPCP